MRRTVLKQSDPRPRRTATLWALAYLVLAVLWILVSDNIVSELAPHETLTQRLQSIKGLLFVVGSAGLVFLALWIPLSRLHSVERRWQHLMDSLDDVVWLASPDGQRLLHINPAVERIYGRTRAEFMARPALWLDVVHPDDRPRVEAAALDLQRGRGRDITYRIQRPDGSQRWLRDRASLVFDADGAVLGQAGQAEDITEERLAAERERVQRDRLEGIVESAMDAIITVDHTQTVCVFNQAASAMFGLPATEALGSPLSRFIPVRYREKHQGLVDAFGRRSGVRQRMGGRTPLAGLRANGEEFPIEASISRSGHGEATPLTATVRDIGEQLKAEAAQQARAEAEAASRQKTEFLSRMSHELRTPLNAVLGFAQLMQSDAAEPLSARQQARVAHVRAAGWHLLALINDVLDLSRVESGRLAFESGEVALTDVVDEARLLCEEQARRLGVAVTWHGVDSAGMSVVGDATRVRQVVINLLSNAIKYNRPDGGEVHLRAYVDGSTCVLQIQDTGEGMSPEQLAHLYEPFNRLGCERSGVDGTGIGLVLARQLVLGMGGELSISSELGVGTLACVALPRASPLATAGPAFDLSAAAPLDGTSVGPQGVVLYIEDNQVNALIVEQLLTRWPEVRCVHADTGKVGIDLAQRLKPDLVLLDMRLPDIDGIAVLEALRSDASTAGLRVVVLSADAMPEERARAASAGAEAYWTKPLDFAQFGLDVERILRR